MLVLLCISLCVGGCNEGLLDDSKQTDLDSSTEIQQVPSTVPQEAIDYALVQAKFFRDPVDDINSLYEHPNYFSFLITRVYSLYQNQTLTIKDISKNDWYKQYLIPIEYMEKASSLYLGIGNGLPDIFYNQADYNYQKTENAFLFSPYSPPMFVTECTNATINNDETINITISISLVEEKSILCENTYVYRIVSDETWGTIYQLISIRESHYGTYESDTSNEKLKSYMNCFVGYFHEPFSIGEIQYPDTILGLVFEYCFYNHNKLNGVEIDETSFKMSINSADFQEVASYLLGDDFEVTKDPRWILLSGRYDEAVDRYVTSFAKDHWGGDSFSIEFGSELTIKEENGKAYVTANVGVWDEVNGNYVPPRTLEYVFNIVEGNGMLHYQIEQISLVE